MMTNAAQQAYEHEKWKHQQRATLFATHMPAVTAFASVAINAAVLVNGAAAIGVLTLLGAAWGKPAFERVLDPAIASLARFAVGAGAAVLVGYLSYVSQWLYAWGDLRKFDDKGYRWFYAVGIGIQIIAVVLAVASIVTFVLGTVAGVQALISAHISAILASRT